MTNRPPQAAAKPKVHVRGRDSGLSLGISACQQRCRACVPAHRQAAVVQASCAGAVGKLQGQGLCGWPLCATRGSRVGLASCLAASAALAATSSCCAVAFSALCAAATVCSAAAAKSAAGRTRHAVLRWRLRRGPSTCRHLSLTPGTITLSRRAVLRVDQLEQFLRALGKQRSVCSLSDVGCRMELSCAPKARIHVLQAPALMTTFLTPSRQPTPLLGAPAVLLRNSCCKSGVFTPRKMPHIYINK